MSELSIAKMNPNTIRHAAADAHALAQVEKWMGVIREIDAKPTEGWAEVSPTWAAAKEGGSARSQH